MQPTLSESIINQASKSEDLFECTFALCEKVSSIPSNDKVAIQESAKQLKQLLKKTISTTKSIDQHLAHTIAKTYVVLRMIEQEISEFKKIEFTQVLQQVLDIASTRVKQKLDDDKETIDVIKEIRGVIADLHGHPEKKMKVTEVVNKIVDKIAKHYEKDPTLDVMKLTSRIMQSNSDSSKKAELAKILST